MGLKIAQGLRVVHRNINEFCQSLSNTLGQVLRTRARAITVTVPYRYRQSMQLMQ